METRDLVNEFMDEETIRVLMAMEEQQSSEWIDIYQSMNYEQKSMYGDGKGRIQVQQHKERWQLMTQDEKDAYHRGMTNYYVRHIRYPGQCYEDRLPGIIQKRLAALDGVPEQFHFFWETSSVFSQWHPAAFEAITWLWPDGPQRVDYLAGAFDADQQMYSSAEQFMMYHKAMLFLDRDTAQKIMSTNNVRKIKDLGRQVQHFEEDVWQFYRTNIVWEGNRAKFSQNETLHAQLLATQGYTLVESAPNDRIWGIGLHQGDEKARQRGTWEGTNLLGDILTDLRVHFAGKY
jgi:ribA/ribD-fused uncharacterized protein